MSQSPIQFGTGGWRAVIGDEFTKANIILVGKAVALRILREGAEKLPVVIGYDRRFLSKEAMIWLGETIASNGIRVKLVQSSCPTPMVMHTVMKNDYAYGLMVTASHNPSLYNGIKLFTRGGRDANEIVTGEVEEILAELTEQDPTSPVRSLEELTEVGLIEFFNPINEYLDDILAKVDVQAIRNAHLKIAVDPLFGVSVRALNTIFATTRCEVEMLHAEHDTLFAGKTPAPDASTVRSLQTRVTDYAFDLGIATDGDADRIGLVDDLGRYVDANEILCILYYYFLEFKKMKTPVVKNLATTCVLERIAAHYGQDCYEVPVGFKYVSAKMAETGAFLGGEGSGGLTVAGHINGKDAIYAATLLVETIAKTGKKLSELADEGHSKFGSFLMKEDNLSFRADRKEELIRRIYREHELPDLGQPVARASYLDGCKVWLEDGSWLLIRFSGTEPLLRIFAEVPAENAALAADLCHRIRAHFQL
ncbi:MAG: phosphoglucomutase/phosphomannomutase family protein [Clostridia bacterium]|nr:phosphoglucomutase/phosphomannomutase family protein [Clostridia bacterium]